MADEELGRSDSSLAEGRVVGPGGTGGRIFKVRLIGEKTGTITDIPQSQQISDDPFRQIYESVSLQKPPFNLDQLQLLSDQHPTHGAALHQKTADVVGKDLEFAAISEQADEKQRTDIEEWLEGLTDNHRTFMELVTVMWHDYETTGQGYWEAARDNNGILRKLWHIPSHTMRAHADKERYVQLRRGRMAWFKRWGGDLEDDILTSTGHKAPGNTSNEKVANEVIVFVVPTSRNTWYGIPGYVGGIGWITMSLAARDYNIKFFSNNREPRWMMIVSGLSEADVEGTLDEITQELRTQHGEPHRNMLVPTTSGVEIKIERLTSVANDLHFVRLLDVADTYITGSHRMPPERIGIVRKGPLGGTSTRDINRTYKDAVVATSQMLLADRLNRLVLVEYSKAAKITPEAILWRIAFSALDIRDEEVEVAMIVEEVKAQIMTLDEARIKRGRQPMEGKKGEVTLAEWLAQHGGSAANFAMEAGQANGQVKLVRALEGLGARMDALDEALEDLGSGREES